MTNNRIGNQTKLTLEQTLEVLHHTAEDDKAVDDVLAPVDRDARLEAPEAEETHLVVRHLSRAKRIGVYGALLIASVAIIEAVTTVFATAPAAAPLLPLAASDKTTVALREKALAEGRAGRYEACVRDLDTAKLRDPVGDQDPPIVAAREKAERALGWLPEGDAR